MPNEKMTKNDGIKEALAFLDKMEERYLLSLEAPGMYAKDATLGKIDAVRTAKRGISKLLES